MARPILRAFERNLRRSRQVLEPGADITATATGVMATLYLFITGQPVWSTGALIEWLAAYGVPVGELSRDRQEAVARSATIISETILSGSALARAAAETPLDRTQDSIPQARDATRKLLDGLTSIPLPGEDIEEMLTALLALIHIRIDDLGGDDTILRLASAEATLEHGQLSSEPACRRLA